MPHIYIYIFLMSPLNLNLSSFHEEVLGLERTSKATREGEVA
jgi:hypothetical protein